MGESVLGEYFKNSNNYDSALYYLELGQNRAEKLGEKEYVLKFIKAKLK